MNNAEGPAVRLGQGSYERTWPPPELNLIRDESAETYHAKAKEHLSSHALADFRKCPLLFRRKELGLIPRRDSSAYAFGRAAHTLILEGRERYEAEYAVGGPINENTGRPFGTQTKAFAEWVEAQGKPVLSDSDAATIEEMAASTRSHAVATDLLANGIPESVARCEYGDHPCQARYDWINPERGLVDYKTCHDLDDFEADAKRYGYIHQIAFYWETFRITTGLQVPAWFVAGEKKEPFRTGVWRVHQFVLSRAMAENERAMADLHRCRQSGHWPTRYETVRNMADL